MEQMSPVDLPPPDEDSAAARPALSWTSVILLVASLFLLVANASTLTGWAEELEPSPVSARVLRAAQDWEVLVEPAGRPRAWLHDRWKALQALRFGKEKPE